MPLFQQEQWRSGLSRSQNRPHVAAAGLPVGTEHGIRSTTEPGGGDASGKGRWVQIRRSVPRLTRIMRRTIDTLLHEPGM